MGRRFCGTSLLGSPGLMRTQKSKVLLAFCGRRGMKMLVSDVVSLYVHWLMVFLFMEKNSCEMLLWNLWGSRLSFSCPSQCMRWRGCWKVLCSPAGEVVFLRMTKVEKTMSKGQGKQLNPSGVKSGSGRSPSRPTVWLKGSVWALGLHVFKASNREWLGSKGEGNVSHLL